MFTFNAVRIVLLKDDLELPKASTTQAEESVSLIGSSEGRTLLREEQDKEYQMSLEMDKKKVADKEYLHIPDRKLKEQIQSARKAPVVAEPSTGTIVTVKIRHSSLGVVSRRFPLNTRMYAVYDWAGSLCTDPTQFILTDPATGSTLQPSSLVQDKHALNMVESSDGTPSLLESDDEVQFLGFGQVFYNR